MESVGAVNWKGDLSLEPFLVPIDSIVDNPRNPNVNPNVQEIAESLKRFGQVHPVTYVDTEAILGDERASVKMMVRGHHTRKAAKLLGWTHIAANPHKFESQSEADVYLIADNQLASLASQDVKAQLDILTETPDLTGTGYTLDDVETFQDQLELVPRVRLDDPERDHSEDEDNAAARAARLAESERHRQFILMMKEEEAESFAEDVKLLGSEYGLTSRVDTVVRAVREAADAARLK
jgi:ParB-like chromosome segregation protein Spo0J